MENRKIDSMEERLAEIGRRIDSAIGEAEGSDVVSRLQDELRVWREWMDEARVQSALAKMEARDLLATLSKAFERLSSRLDAALVDMKEDVDPMPGDLTAAVQEAFDKDPTLFLTADALVEDSPDESTEPVGHPEPAL